MYGLVIEKHILNNKLLSRDLTEVLFDRAVYGKTIVVTDKPTVLHSTIRRRWQHLARRLQIDRSRTLNHETINNINNQLYIARFIRFSSRLPKDYELDANITFMKPSDCLRLAPVCQTLCVACEVPREKLHLMTAWMPKGSRVVLYG